MCVLGDERQQCIEELKAKAVVSEKTGVISVMDATACVLKSDTAIPAELQAELQAAVKPLEDVPAHQRDWHPHSEGELGMEIMFMLEEYANLLHLCRQSTRSGPSVHVSSYLWAIAHLD